MFVLVGAFLAVKASGVLTPPEAALSCTWSRVYITGGTAPQTGAVRCYLAALAHRDTGSMRKVVPQAEYGGEGTVEKAAFKYARDAASGTASVKIVQNEVDSADAEIIIRYADGVKDVHELRIADPMSSVDWRFWDVNDHTSEDYIT